MLEEDSTKPSDDEPSKRDWQSADSADHYIRTTIKVDD